jgi:parallel beta-helix repeat protein
MLLFVSSVNLAWGDDVVVYIRSDGVVEPSGVSISVDESTYTLTGNISGSIVVERGNVVLDGRGNTLHISGVGAVTGIYVAYVNNVTIENMRIENATMAILLHNSQGSTILNNTITKSGGFMSYVISDKIGYLQYTSSADNVIANNVLTDNMGSMISLYGTNTLAFGNNITDNNGVAFWLSGSDNTIFNNNLARNGGGFSLDEAWNNTIYNNNIVDSSVADVYFSSSTNGSNTWDNGLPSGGNYWSNYTGVDEDSDGVGDTPFIINDGNQDNYPLMGEVDISVIPDFTVWSSSPSFYVYMYLNRVYTIFNRCKPSPTLQPRPFGWFFIQFNSLNSIIWSKF